ncbi:4-carboxymuconolactone decarboxylase [Thraustotheca clavata]|uniref:4-carboxymuconolactone decarboxylase n=1 Tax=Thraustotheca clavata TaxID=74557 RepID=A0A1W0AAA5_9STRA|nr:4-carboxymuconolactone decarboxylase [Thraustotheca clavata]
MAQGKETADERYARGLATLEHALGDAGINHVKAFAGTAPELARLIVEFPYGDIYSRPGLDAKTRQIVTISALAALGNAAPQLRVHIFGALNVGVAKDEIIEIFMQLAVYAGFPAALNAILAAKEVFAEWDSRNVSTNIL